MVRSTPMMVMTTSNSISVNPAALRSPIMVRHSIDPLALCHGVDVENVIAGLRIGRRTLGSAQSPRFRRRYRRVGEQRIARYTPQEIHHHFFFALRILDPVDEQLQVRRVARI